MEILGFKNKDYLTTVMNQLYEEIDDKYEVVIFIANQSESDKTLVIRSP